MYNDNSFSRSPLASAHAPGTVEKNERLNEFFRNCGVLSSAARRAEFFSCP
jgi:hypothetical protein